MTASQFHNGHQSQAQSIKVLLQKDHKRSNSMVASQSSISSQSFKKKTSGQIVPENEEIISITDQQMLIHNKFQVLTKLQILLRSEKLQE